MADNSEESRNLDTYRTGTSDDRLVQMHTRFRRSTLKEIEEISEGMKWTKASVIRRLVEVGLMESNLNTNYSRKVTCLNCSESMIEVEEEKYVCKNCKNKIEMEL
jgi:hypothetical protein